MTEAQWYRLSRRQQLRIIKDMQRSTARAFNVEGITVERMLSGFWESIRTMARPPVDREAELIRALSLVYTKNEERTGGHGECRMCSRWKGEPHTEECLMVVVEGILRTIGEEQLAALYPPDAPRCLSCGRPYSKMEAKAGFKTCEHC